MATRGHVRILWCEAGAAPGSFLTNPRPRVWDQRGGGRLVSGSRRSPEERIGQVNGLVVHVGYFFLSGSNRCRFGLRYLVHSTPCWPCRSVVGPADTGPSPCADVGQPDRLVCSPSCHVDSPGRRGNGPSQGLFTRTQRDPPLGIPKLDRQLVHSPSLLHVAGSASLLGPPGAWGEPNLQPQVARCGCRWRATPKLATV